MTDNQAEEQKLSGVKSDIYESLVEDESNEVK